jgi:flagellar hook assembly protein FlgD
LEYDGVNPPVNTLLLTASVSASAFGVDESQELYLCGLDGMIYSFAPSLVVSQVAEQREETPRTLLVGNSPNPFNPSTRITFQLGESNNVRLTIHNVLGERVRTLIDEPMGEGTQTVVWDGRIADGSPASSGLYFCRLETGTITQTLKMLLTK